VKGSAVWEDCDESIGYGSTVYDYCKYLLFNKYHSKETGGITELAVPSSLRFVLFRISTPAPCSLGLHGDDVRYPCIIHLFVQRG